jgi:integrase
VIRLHIIPGLGALPLTAVTRDRIRSHIATLDAKGLGSQRKQLVLSVVCACLHAAVDAGHIPSNPAVRLGRYAKNPNDPIRVVEIFTPTELDQLLQTAQEHVPVLYPLVFVMARTGLRLGEALTLQIGDVDFTQRELWVRRSWGTGRRSDGPKAIGTPKNKRLRRVDMSRQLTEALQKHLTLREAEAILAGTAYTAESWLFPGPGGGPMTRNMFQPQWRRLLKAAGVRHRKAHTLRHTFASQLLQNGESLAYVRDQLGHHSIKLTVDVYGHLIPGANKAAVDRLDSQPAATPVATAPVSHSAEVPSIH